MRRPTVSFMESTRPVSAVVSLPPASEGPSHGAIVATVKELLSIVYRLGGQGCMCMTMFPLFRIAPRHFSSVYRYLTDFSYILVKTNRLGQDSGPGKRAGSSFVVYDESQFAEYIDGSTRSSSQERSVARNAS